MVYLHVQFYSQDDKDPTLLNPLFVAYDRRIRCLEEELERLKKVEQEVNAQNMNMQAKVWMALLSLRSIGSQHSPQGCWILWAHALGAARIPRLSRNQFVIALSQSER